MQIDTSEVAQTSREHVEHWEADARHLLITAVRSFDTDAHGYLYQLTQNGGKGFRRQILFEAARSGTYAPIRATVVRLAVAVELLHLASLIHDDFVDGALVRRGIPTPRATIGDELTLLLGVRCAIEAVKTVASAGHGFSLVFAAGAKRLALGQINDVERSDDDVTLDEYVEMVARKTGSLVALAAILGAGAAGHLTGWEASALRIVGSDLGIAFQLVDDLEDVLGSAADKPRGLDSYNGVHLSASPDHLIAIAQDRLGTAREGWAAVFGCLPSGGSVFDLTSQRLVRLM